MYVTDTVLGINNSIKRVSNLVSCYVKTEEIGAWDHLGPTEVLPYI